MANCHNCNRDFRGLKQLNQHLGASARHASCQQCRNGFASLRDWNSHFYASHVPQLQSGRALSNQTGRVSKNQTGRVSKVKTGRVVKNQTGRVSTDQTGGVLTGMVQSGLTIPAVRVHQPYCGIPGDLIKPVFKMVLQLRFNKPTPELVIARTGTGLDVDVDVVNAIVESTFRLLPPPKTPREKQLQREKEIEKNRKAEEAETAFIKRLIEIDPGLVREKEQHTRIKAAVDAGHKDTPKLTPDARLSKTTLICGKECTWVEFKNMFGFRSSPFLAKKHKQQLRKYAENLGPGMLVFKLVYETNHIQIEGVHCFREAELIEWLDS